MMASIHANDMIKRENQNALIDTYNRIKSEKDIVVQELGEDEQFNSKHIERRYKNNMSLKITTEALIELLNTSFPKDCEILYFLSCLPSGIIQEELEKMWETNVQETIENFNKLYFLDQSVDRISLTPFMLYYCNNTVDKDLMNSCQRMVCSYY